MTLSEDVIEKLKAEHGELTQLTHGPDEVIVRTPNRAQWKRFRAQIGNEKRRDDALELLLRDCVVHPEKADFDAMLDRRPGLAETFGAQVVELAGAVKEPEKKAL